MGATFRCDFSHPTSHPTWTKNSTESWREEHWVRKVAPNALPANFRVRKVAPDSLVYIFEMFFFTFFLLFFCSKTSYKQLQNRLKQIKKTTVIFHYKCHYHSSTSILTYSLINKHPNLIRQFANCYFKINLSQKVT